MKKIYYSFIAFLLVMSFGITSFADGYNETFDVTLFIPVTECMYSVSVCAGKVSTGDSNSWHYEYVKCSSDSPIYVYSDSSKNTLYFTCDGNMYWSKRTMEKYTNNSYTDHVDYPTSTSLNGYPVFISSSDLSIIYSDTDIYSTKEDMLSQNKDFLYESEPFKNFPILDGEYKHINHFSMTGLYGPNISDNQYGGHQCSELYTFGSDSTMCLYYDDATRCYHAMSLRPVVSICWLYDNDLSDYIRNDDGTVRYQNTQNSRVDRIEHEGKNYYIYSIIFKNIYTRPSARDKTDLKIFNTEYEALCYLLENKDVDNALLNDPIDDSDNHVYLANFNCGFLSTFKGGESSDRFVDVCDNFRNGQLYLDYSLDNYQKEHIREFSVNVHIEFLRAGFKKVGGSVSGGGSHALTSGRSDWDNELTEFNYTWDYVTQLSENSYNLIPCDIILTDCGFFNYKGWICLVKTGSQLFDYSTANLQGFTEFNEALGGLDRGNDFLVQTQYMTIDVWVSDMSGNDSEHYKIKYNLCDNTSEVLDNKISQNNQPYFENELLTESSMTNNSGSISYFPVYQPTGGSGADVNINIDANDNCVEDYVDGMQGDEETIHKGFVDKFKEFFSPLTDNKFVEIYNRFFGFLPSDIRNFIATAIAICCAAAVFKFFHR